jgi:hypothetical protein
MNHELLISCQDKGPENFQFLRSRSDLLTVINQSSNNLACETDDFVFRTFNERGLSKSRNKALVLGRGSICQICDDDIQLPVDSSNIIKGSFSKYPDADVITFAIQTPNGRPYKSYRKESFQHGIYSILKVSSIEICFRLESIRQADIKFDERFGLGSEFNSGEENIFLADCLRKGLKVIYCPENIVIHDEISSGKTFDENYFYGKGALFKRIYGPAFSMFLLLAFITKTFLFKKVTIPLTIALKSCQKGYLSI